MKRIAKHIRETYRRIRKDLETAFWGFMDRLPKSKPLLELEELKRKIEEGEISLEDLE